MNEILSTPVTGHVYALTRPATSSNGEQPAWNSMAGPRSRPFAGAHVHSQHQFAAGTANQDCNFGSMLLDAFPGTRFMTMTTCRRSIRSSVQIWKIKPLPYWVQGNRRFEIQRNLRAQRRTGGRPWKTASAEGQEQRADHVSLHTNDVLGDRATLGCCFTCGGGDR